MTDDELSKWYNIMILQQTEEEVITKLSCNDKGKQIELPPPDEVRESVLQRIKEKDDKREERIKFLEKLQEDENNG